MIKSLTSEQLRLQLRILNITNVLKQSFVNNEIIISFNVIQIEKLFRKNYKNNLRNLAKYLDIAIPRHSSLCWHLLLNNNILLQFIIFHNLRKDLFRLSFHALILYVIELIPVKFYLTILYRCIFYSIFNKKFFMTFDRTYTKIVTILPIITYAKYCHKIYIINKNSMIWHDHLLFVYYMQHNLLKYHDYIHRVRLGVVMPSNDSVTETCEFTVAGVYFPTEKLLTFTDKQKIISQALVKMYRDLRSIHTEEYYYDIIEMHYIIRIDLLDENYLDMVNFSSFNTIDFTAFGKNIHKLSPEPFNYVIES